MKIETRTFAKGKPEEKRQLIFIAETHEDSRLIDWAFGESVDVDGTISQLRGEVKLSDGFVEHYIRLEKA